MMAIAACCGLPAKAPVQTATVQEPRSAIDFSMVFHDASWQAREWHRGYVLGVRLHPANGPAVAVYDEAGHLKQEASVRIPDATSVSIASATLTPTNTVWMAGGATDASGRVVNFL